MFNGKHADEDGSDGQREEREAQGEQRAPREDADDETLATWRFAPPQRQRHANANANANGNSEKKQVSVSFSEPPDRDNDGDGGDGGGGGGGDDPPPAHHRRRNRLEARLEELQRDVANLTLRLRASSNSNSNSNSNATASASRTEAEPDAEAEAAGNGRTGVAGKPRSTRRVLPPEDDGGDRLMQQRLKKRRSPAGDEANGLKTAIEMATAPSAGSKSRVTPTRSARTRSADTLDTSMARGGDGSVTSRSSRAGRDATRALRELQVMAVERDQLRMELDQAKKTITAMERKLEEAGKWRQAYDKMKTHCSSLQESEMASAGLDATVNKTYLALLSVVQTTAVTKRVLARPPFTFLHKLLVETLSEFRIFTDQQLIFTELITKEDKAAFLTRAIAFVSFTKTRLQDKCVNVLFLVSPVKVLAGVAVEDTLEFLQQLCDVCRSPDRETKELAAIEVQQKGDAHLYTAGVTFRKGLVLIQAIVRAFIRRRVKRKATENTTRSIAPPPKEPLRLEVGTRFLKELVNGRIYDGVIVAIVDKRYRVQYDQDPGAEDDVAHDFMNHIDKDGNGSIDVDEFEELVRVARRNEAQREQLRKELQHSKKQTTTEPKSTNKYAALVKHRQRIVDELRTLAVSDAGALSVSQVKTALARLQIAGLADSLVSDLIERAQAQLQLSSSSSKGLVDPRPSGKRAADGVVYISNMTKVLNELSWSCKSNRFLDQSWLAQFDSQLERAQRDFELL
ncbi:hypothetical protein ATCC90586_006574 [Pythium insidiosum]|nr:hypothetical protein ATCC90586_006574 [Pythium insidiosum]